MPSPAKSFQALGDPTRLKIVRMLAKGPLAVGEIAEKLPVSRPAVSKHLRLLAEAGLVESESEGTRNIFRLRGQGFAEMRECLDEMWDLALARYKLYVENTRGESK